MIYHQHSLETTLWLFPTSGPWGNNRAVSARPVASPRSPRVGHPARLGLLALASAHPSVCVLSWLQTITALTDLEFSFVVGGNQYSLNVIIQDGVPGAPLLGECCGRSTHGSCCWCLPQCLPRMPACLPLTLPFPSLPLPSTSCSRMDRLLRRRVCHAFPGGSGPDDYGPQRGHRRPHRRPCEEERGLLDAHSDRHLPRGQPARAARVDGQRVPPLVRGQRGRTGSAGLPVAALGRAGGSSALLMITPAVPPLPPPNP